MYKWYYPVPLNWTIYFYKNLTFNDLTMNAIIIYNKI